MTGEVSVAEKNLARQKQRVDQITISTSQLLAEHGNVFQDVDGASVSNPGYYTDLSGEEYHQTVAVLGEKAYLIDTRMATEDKLLPFSRDEDPNLTLRVVKTIKEHGTTTLANPGSNIVITSGDRMIIITPSRPTNLLDSGMNQLLASMK